MHVRSFIADQIWSKTGKNGRKVIAMSNVRATHICRSIQLVSRDFAQQLFLLQFMVALSLSRAYERGKAAFQTYFPSSLGVDNFSPPLRVRMSHRKVADGLPPSTSVHFHTDPLRDSNESCFFRSCQTCMHARQSSSWKAQETRSGHEKGEKNMTKLRLTDTRESWVYPSTLSSYIRSSS